MFSFGFMGTVASVLAGGAIAAVTIVGVVNSTVDSKPANPGSVAGSTIMYGTR